MPGRSPNDPLKDRKRKNADAQAQFRQRRANYISSLEETVTKLEAVILELQDSLRDSKDHLTQVGDENRHLVDLLEQLRHEQSSREGEWRAAWLSQLPDLPFPHRSTVTESSASSSAPPGSPSNTLLDHPCLDPALQAHSRSRKNSLRAQFDHESASFRTEFGDHCGGSDAMLDSVPLSFRDRGQLEAPSKHSHSFLPKTSDQFSPATMLQTLNSPRKRVKRTHSPRFSPSSENTSASSGQAYFPDGPSVHDVHSGGPNLLQSSSNSIHHSDYLSRNMQGEGSRHDQSGASTHFEHAPPDGLHGDLLDSPDNSSWYFNGDSSTLQQEISTDPAMNTRDTTPLGQTLAENSPGYHGKEDSSSPPVSGTLAVIKAQAFGALRRNRSQKKQRGNGRATKAALEVLQARGLGLGLEPASTLSGQLDDLSREGNRGASTLQEPMKDETVDFL